jgi:3-dehydroquinate synthase
MKLNLGHTIGHGVEARSEFSFSHGKSVAIGMAIVARASHCVDAGRIVKCLERFGLPATAQYPAKDIYSYTLSDKKRSGGTVKLIIPEKIGHCAIVPTPVEEILPLIKEGL